MKHLDSFEKLVYDRTINNADILKEKLTNDNFAEVEDYMADEFIKMFEDLFVNQLMYDLIDEGWFSDKYNQAKDWVKDKAEDVKDAAGDIYDDVKDNAEDIVDDVKQGYQNAKKSVKKGINVVGDAMKGFKDAIIAIFNKLREALKNISFPKMMEKAKKGFKELKKKAFAGLAEVFECLRLPLIDLGWVTEDNTFKTKVAYKQILTWTKEDKELSGGVEIDKNQKEFGMLNNEIDDMKMEGVHYYNESMGINEKNIHFDAENSEVYQKHDKDGNLISGKNLTKDSLKTGNYGYFKKLLLKMGVKHAKVNSFLSVLMKSAIVIGLMSLLITPILAGMGLTLAGAGAVVVGALGYGVIMLLTGILVALGLFMLVVWVIKPYPDIYELKAYLAAWFKMHPGGYPSDWDTDDGSTTTTTTTTTSDETTTVDEKVTRTIEKRLKRIAQNKAMTWELVQWYFSKKYENEELKAAILEMLKDRNRFDGSEFTFDDLDKLKEEGEVQKEHLNIKKVKRLILKKDINGLLVLYFSKRYKKHQEEIKKALISLHIEESTFLELYEEIKLEKKVTRYKRKVAKYIKKKDINSLLLLYFSKTYLAYQEEIKKALISFNIEESTFKELYEEVKRERKEKRIQKKKKTTTTTDTKTHHKTKRLDQQVVDGKLRPGITRTTH